MITPARRPVFLSWRCNGVTRRQAGHQYCNANAQTAHGRSGKGMDGERVGGKTLLTANLMRR
eukprot:2179926-Amphidinium_carterae.1